jgi:hypothetical protein
MDVVIFIILWMIVILPIVGVCYLISLLFKSSGFKGSDYNNSIEKDKN